MQQIAPHVPLSSVGRSIAQCNHAPMHAAFSARPRHPTVGSASSGGGKRYGDYTAQDVGLNLASGQTAFETATHQRGAATWVPSHMLRTIDAICLEDPGQLVVWGCMPQRTGVPTNARPYPCIYHLTPRLARRKPRIQHRLNKL